MRPAEPNADVADRSDQRANGTPRSWRRATRLFTVLSIFCAVVATLGALGWMLATDRAEQAIRSRLDRLGERLDRTVHVGGLTIDLLAATEQVVLTDVRLVAAEARRGVVVVPRIAFTVDRWRAARGAGRAAVTQVVVDSARLELSGADGTPDWRVLLAAARAEARALAQVERPESTGPGKALPPIRIGPLRLDLRRTAGVSTLATARVTLSPLELSVSIPGLAGESGTRAAAVQIRPRRVESGWAVDMAGPLRWRGVPVAGGPEVQASLEALSVAWGAPGERRVTVLGPRASASMDGQPVQIAAERLVLEPPGDGRAGRAELREVSADGRAGRWAATTRVETVGVELGDDTPQEATLGALSATLTDGSEAVRRLTASGGLVRRGGCDRCASVTLSDPEAGALGSAASITAEGRWPRGEAPSLATVTVQRPILRATVPELPEAIATQLITRLSAGAKGPSDAEPTATEPTATAAGPLGRWSQLVAAVAKLPGPLRTTALTLADGRLELRTPGEASRTITGWTATTRLERAKDPSAPPSLTVSTSWNDGDSKTVRVTATTRLVADPEPLEVQLSVAALPVGRFAAPRLPSWRIPPSFTLDGDVTMRWSRVDRKLALRGALSGRNAGLYHRQLADDPVTNISFDLADLELAADLAKEPPSVTMTVPKLTLGPATLSATLEVARLERKPRFELRAQFPRQPCQRFVDAVPAALRGPLTMRVSGDLEWRARLRLDFRRPKATRLKIKGDWSACHPGTLSASLDAQLRRLKRGRYTFIWPGGHRVGPGAKGYLRLSELPKWVPGGALMTEDGRFYKHGGFMVSSLQRALKYALEKGRFWYGGSTITQQLVKNLFLNRKKHLARKVREALITWHLERTFDKDAILELYLNVIEYGPDLYGIGRAARFYFGKSARRLTPLETAFLMGLKPQPKWGYSLWKRNKTSKRWQKLLKNILKRMARTGWLTDEQVEAAAPYVLTFRRPD